MALKLMKNFPNPLDSLTAIDAQLDAINGEIQLGEAQAINTKETESVTLEDFESWKNDATRFLASILACTTRDEARGIRHHLAGLSERGRTDILFGLALNIAGDKAVRSYLDVVSRMIDGQISSAEKELLLKEKYAKKAELDDAREKICESIEAAGGFADRRPDSDMSIVLRFQSNRKFDREKFENILAYNLETGNRSTKLQEILRDLKKERQALLDFVIKSQSAWPETDVQQARAKTAAADAAELSIRIERVVSQMAELREQWERRCKVYNACEQFLRSKGVSV